jgi:multicomponent Na+:H+ antiporter subunit A
VVTVILADFRGLDTLVEVTVLAVAIVGVAGLLRRGRAW